MIQSILNRTDYASRQSDKTLLPQAEARRSTLNLWNGFIYLLFIVFTLLPVASSAQQQSPLDLLYFVENKKWETPWYWIDSTLTIPYEERFNWQGVCNWGLGDPKCDWTTIKQRIEVIPTTAKIILPTDVRGAFTVYFDNIGKVRAVLVQLSINRDSQLSQALSKEIINLIKSIQCSPAIHESAGKPVATQIAANFFLHAKK